jgi:hypothetical protein
MTGRHQHRDEQILALLAAAVAVAALILAPGPAMAGDERTDIDMVECTMDFTLKGWSAFYRTAKGHGTVHCDNGQQAEVVIRAKGGGITFGKTEILDGKGVFSEVKDISEIFGSYVEATAHAGAVRSAGATAMTKGEISLALSGTGRGMDLGIAFGKFTIQRPEEAEAQDREEAEEDAEDGDEG